MGFCRAIAMIAKLNERNTFVVSRTRRGTFRRRAAAGAYELDTPPAGDLGITEPNLVKKRARWRANAAHIRK
jgi:hypothetical protein